MKAKAARHLKTDDLYSRFDQIDGRHPWIQNVPEGLILYPVRKLKQGRVTYFNFELAKEMGLIGKDHPHRLTKKLQEKILETFSLRIINEYDQLHGHKYPRKVVRRNPYMATRYLQLQHSDKTGRTSGDGRCIWNGFVSHRGLTWDVSSRGTGVTALAPGAVEAGKPLKSGNFDHGYGCGMAEIDELFGSALMAEIMHRNGFHTERMLTIIDLGRGVGIGVRAGLNLIRPAHLFLYLKQGRREPLQRAVDYFLNRQRANRRWNIDPKEKNAYPLMLEQICESFARFVAHLDREYIFAWLDWDGDNVLADAGIIDYGSVRQFGLRHDQYRYDDIQRFSTNLNEQRLKAREMVQTFAQLTDFLVTGTKKPWNQFTRHPILKKFDRRVQHHMLDHFLYQVGFDEPLKKILMNRHRQSVEEFYRVHSYFERVKTYRKLQRVADGVQRPAIFNMRQVLAHMPDYLIELPYELLQGMPAKEFFRLMLSSQADSRDRRMTERIGKRIQRWQNHYIKLVKKVSSPVTWQKTMQSIQARAQSINQSDRMTGNALIHIVDDLLKYKKRGLSDADIQAVIDEFIELQTLCPDFQRKQMSQKTEEPDKFHPLTRNFLSVVAGYREDI